MRTTVLLRWHISTLKLDKEVLWVTARWRHKNDDDAVTTWCVHVTPTYRRITGVDCEHVIIRLACWSHFRQVHHWRTCFVKLAPFPTIYHHSVVTYMQPSDTGCFVRIQFPVQKIYLGTCNQLSLVIPPWVGTTTGPSHSEENREFCIAVKSLLISRSGLVASVAYWPSQLKVKLWAVSWADVGGMLN